MVSNDKCLDLSVIPQFGGTCWFNAILMIALYSQNVRKVLMKHSKKWDKSNSFLMILKRVLFIYYKHPEKVQEFFNKIRPETILLKMLKKFNDSETIEYFKNKNKKEIQLGFYLDYITDFFRYIGVNTLFIAYSNKNGYYLNIDKEIGNLYLNDTKKTQIYIKNYEKFKTTDEVFLKRRDKEVFMQNSKSLNDVPDIIILEHEELMDGFNKTFIYNYISLYIDNYKSTHYNFNVQGLDTYQNIIYLNGHKYKLDAITLQNYNYLKINSAHAIAGITCNNNHYVYNGWNSATNDPGLKDKKEGSVLPCSLMKYDWNVRKDEGFCLNTKTCKLDFIEPSFENKELCFSFAKDKRLLIYVRVDDDNMDIDKILKGDISSKTPQLSGVSEMIKNIHNIEELSKQELLEALFHNFNLVNLNKNSISKLRDLYYKLLIKNYNLKQSKPKPKPKSKPKEINDIINKYPHMKNLYDNKPQIKVVNEKPLLKKDLKDTILVKYPHMKNVNFKTKNDLVSNFDDEKQKKTVLKKKDLIELIKKQKPKLKGLAKLTKAQLENILK